MLTFLEKFARDALIAELQPSESSRGTSESWFLRSAAVESGSLSVVALLWNLRDDFPPSAICSAIGIAFDGGYADIAAFLIAKVEARQLKLAIRSVMRDGAYRGTVEVAKELVPFMEDESDITEFIAQAVEASNNELATFWIGWQRRRNPGVSFEGILRAGMKIGDLEVAVLLGTPSEDSFSTIIAASIEYGFFKGWEFAFGFLSGTTKLTAIRRFMAQAVESPAPEIAAFFIAENPRSREALIPSIKLGNISVVQQLLELNNTADYANVVTSVGTPLGVAAATGDVNLVRLLLSVPGIDAMMPDLEGNSPFVNACKHTTDSAVWKLLVDFCADDYYELNSGFFYASQLEKIDVVFELWPFFSNFAVFDPNFQKDSSSAFVRAGKSGKVDLLRLLLGFDGINVNARDEGGSTALIEACSGELGCLDLLLADQRVDVNLVNVAGWSALSIAARDGRVEVVTRLLACDRLDLRNSGGRALSAAIAHQHGDISQLLLARADLDVNESCPLGSLEKDDLLLEISFSLLAFGGFPTDGTPLLIAVNLRDHALAVQIAGHPRFDPIRSDVAAALCMAIGLNELPTFTAILGANVGVRFRTGLSLLAAALLRGGAGFVEHIRNHPGFDMGKEIPEQLLWACASDKFIEAMNIVAALPGIDVNAPLPHYIGFFPEITRTNRLITDYGGPAWDVHLHWAGKPVLFVAVGYYFGSPADLSSPSLDFNQRGEHGESVLFESSAERWLIKHLVRNGRLDRDATDRHGNSAVLCRAIFARRLKRLQFLIDLNCDLSLRNENGSTAWELLRDRIKRRSAAIL